MEDLLCASNIFLGNDHHEADAHVEHTIHLIAIDATLILNEVEDRRNFPRSAVDLGIDTLGENTRNVVRKSTARDMSHAVDLDLVRH